MIFTTTYHLYGVVSVAVKRSAFVALLMFACAETSGAAAPDSTTDILKVAQQQAIQLQTVSFAVDVSIYPSSTLRFFAKGTKVRFEGNLPFGEEKRVSDEAVTISAFDDSLYQEVCTIGRFLAFSRQPLGGNLQAGPCWTPIEQCYRWLEIAEPDFQWSSIRDPAAWSKVSKLVTGPLHADEGREDVYTVVLRNDNGISVRVHFDAAHGCYPILWETIDLKGEVVEHCSADDLQYARGEAGAAFVPLVVNYFLAAHGAAFPAQELRYVIDRSTLHINEPIDDSIFTLNREDFPSLDTIFDRDRHTMRDLATGAVRNLEHRGAPVEEGQVARISTFMIINFGIVALVGLIMAVSFLRNKTRAKRLE